MDNKLLKNLLIINLMFLAILLYSKLSYIHKLLQIVSRSILVPLLISIFIYYIIKPLNEIFIKKGIKRGWASLLTLTISIFILSGVINYFSTSIALQFHDIIKQLTYIIEDKKTREGFLNKIAMYINIEDTYKYITGMAQTYFRQLIRSIITVLGYILNTFSTLLLIFVIAFYMLKDGNKFKDKILFFVPEKYKFITSKTLSESDSVLSHYVTGQAKVALSLSIMIFIGYKIIGMPNALLFSFITFILAFIPFVGFFISMVIPSVVAISLGLNMIIKVVVVFIIVQTLKGRVVVPTIMARAMKIHPLTDIFLVIAAVAVGGPIAAFAVVPIYAVLKTAASNLYDLKRKD